MPESTIILIGYALTGIIFLYTGYKVFKKIRHIPNKIIQIVSVLGVFILGIGLYSAVSRGVPFFYKLATTQATPENNEQTPNTQSQTTGSTQTGGSTPTSGVVINAQPTTEEEVVSWTTLQEKLKHIPVTERHGSPSGQGPAQ